MSVAPRDAGGGARARPPLRGQRPGVALSRVLITFRLRALKLEFRQRVFLPILSQPERCLGSRGVWMSSAERPGCPRPAPGRGGWRTIVGRGVSVLWLVPCPNVLGGRRHVRRAQPLVLAMLSLSCGSCDVLRLGTAFLLRPQAGGGGLSSSAPQGPARAQCPAKGCHPAP